MNKFIKILLKTFLYLAVLFLLGYLGLAIYINIHKEEILGNVSDKIENEINGNVDIRDISLSFFRNFPKISVLLSDVEITDLEFEKHHTPFFKGKDVFVQIDIQKLLKKHFSIKEVKIEQAQFYVYTDSTGYTNGYLFKLKEDAKKVSSPGKADKVELRRVVLKDVGVIIDDQEKNKFYDLHTNKLAVNINDSDTSLELSIKAHLLIHKLIFSPGGREILKDQKVDGNFDLLYDKQVQLLHTDSMDLKVGGQPFNLNFTIDMKSPAPKFHLKVNKGSIPFADVRSFLKNRSKKRITSK